MQYYGIVCILFLLFMLVLYNLVLTTFQIEIKKDECKLTDWFAEGDCSASCGDGFQKFRRFKMKDSSECEGESMIKYVKCTNETCATNCVGYFRDEDWSECTVSCGGGTQNRPFHQITAPSETGKACPSSETRACNTEPCVEQCQGEWTPWSPCSERCNTGTQQRTFTSTNNEDLSLNCPTIQTRTCNEQECPIDCEGYYSNERSPCSAACGGGLQYQNFIITTLPNATGKRCPPLNRTLACNMQECST